MEIKTNKVKLRQILDWRAALIASLLSGIIFWILNTMLPPYFGMGNTWVWVRLFASIGMGSDVLAPPATFDLGVLVVGLGLNTLLSIGFGAVVTFVIHRGGLLFGILGGALLGLALYVINFYSLTYFYPWFFAMKSNLMVVTHVIFGALVGGIYEVLEVERYEAEDES